MLSVYLRWFVILPPLCLGCLEVGTPRATSTTDAGTSASVDEPASLSGDASPAGAIEPAPESSSGAPSSETPLSSRTEQDAAPGTTSTANSVPALDTGTPTEATIGTLDTPMLPDAGLSGGAASTPPAVTLCGNGVVDGVENCDDENAQAGDGCNAHCRIESGWVCATGEPSVCSPVCGDGLLVGDETKAGGCDDKNTANGDGCSKSCRVEKNYTCSNAPSLCDLNECAAGTAHCDTHATCTDQVTYASASFACACNTGYKGNGITCSQPPSCVGLANNCGSSSNDNCCSSPVVEGGSYKMGGTSGTTNATVATFALDKYEVTVGRFRQFVNAYQGPPAAGTGAHPLIAGTGWQSAWNGNIATDATTLATAVQCDSTYETWDATGKNDRLPINCISWYEAFAFCAWDGGRLATEAEWEYAADGGSGEWLYPWGNAPAPSNAPDSTADYANYAGLGDGSAAFSYAFADVLAAGSKPSGAGKYGQLDLAGSMWEWNFDSYASPLPSTCDNCTNSVTSPERVLRGGYWGNVASNLLAAYRYDDGPASHYYYVGVRCARTP